jgi:Holliday junction resolvasome RuvABC ATP-dependent DNA helicase subunit
MVEVSYMADYFEGVVGQDRVKETLKLYIDGHKKTKTFPSLLFVAPKGVGKTHLCLAVGKALGKPLVEVNGATIKNLKQMTNQVFNEISDKEVTLFIDEVHEIPDKVVAVFLSILNPTIDNKNVVTLDGSEYVFDFTKLTVLFATTERQKIFAPLLDRLEEITLEDYSPPEVARIMKSYTNTVPITDEALTFLSTYCRGNARDATKMGRKVATFAAVHVRNIFDVPHAKQLIRVLNLYEWGLNSEEVKTLRILAKHPQGLPLGVLAAKTGMTPQAQASIEKYPQRHNLMVVDGKRMITPEGREYIKRLEVNDAKN